MRIHIENIVTKTNNARELDQVHVSELAQSIARYGLFQSPVVVRYGKADGVMQYAIKAGFHRQAALERLSVMTDAEIRKLGSIRHADGSVVEGRTFEELFPEGKIDYQVVEAEYADAATSVENTARKDLTPAELCLHVWALAEAGVDQHEIAARCTMNQGRVSEFMSLHKAIPQAHDAWLEEQLTLRDMLALAAMPEDKQKAHLAALLAAGGKASDDPKAGRKAKAEARKGMLDDAKGMRRGYQNAGKPSRKRLGVLTERIAKATKEGTEASKGFYEITALTFAFVDGRIDEKAFIKAAAAYGAVDVFTDPEKPKAEKKPTADKPAKAEKKPKAEKPKADKPAKAEKKPKAGKPAKKAKKAKK